MKACLACGQRFEGADWRCPNCGQFPQLLHGYLAFAPGPAEGNAGFNEASFEQLSKLEVKDFWFRSRNRLLCWALRKYFPNSKTLFEPRCGTGFVVSVIS